MKVFKSIMRVLILSALICVIFLCGVYSTKYQQNIEENKSTITTIAVVNADVGTVVDEENVYYATALMSFPDTNFETASLTAAREGMESGRYAAYVLIPKDFSGSVESVNQKPEKSQVTYVVNENLRQDVQVKVVNDIHNFVLNLSTNVSYMYVDAILKEIHSVQDDSKSIMKNDIADMEAITEVNPEELIDEVKYDPLAIVETEIEYLDLSDDYEEVDDAVEEINKTYGDDIEAAEAEFARIKEEGASVDEQAVATAEVFANVDILMDADENLVYETGMENLENLASEFAEEVDDKKFVAKARLGFQAGDKEPEPESKLEEGEVRDYLSKENLLDAVNAQIQYLMDIKEKKYGSDDTDYEDELTADPYYAIEYGGSVDSKEALDAAIRKLYQLKKMINRYYEDAIRAINEIPDASEFASDAETIILDEIEGPIMEETTAEAQRVSETLTIMQTVIEEYVTKLDEYDAMSYLELDIIQEHLSSLYKTINDMEKEIMEQDDAYMEYINEVIKTTDSNVQMLQENLSTSYEQTQGNVEEMMEAFQLNRTDLNKQNVILLNDITGKLPYTRLGNLAYTQVYDFIAQPLVSNDESVHKVKLTPTSISMDWEDLVYMVIGIIALVIIDISVQLIYKKYLKNINGEGGEEWLME